MSYDRVKFPKKLRNLAQFSSKIHIDIFEIQSFNRNMLKNDLCRWPLLCLKFRFRIVISPRNFGFLTLLPSHYLLRAKHVAIQVSAIWFPKRTGNVSVSRDKCVHGAGTCDMCRCRWSCRLITYQRFNDEALKCASDNDRQWNWNWKKRFISWKAWDLSLQFSSQCLYCNRKFNVLTQLAIFIDSFHKLWWASL